MEDKEVISQASSESETENENLNHSSRMFKDIQQWIPLNEAYGR
ncbi:10663_t:CDS:2 [Funneliformis caledonium]|uniref:10663_t:CDS:1 n=1 Tax=Funneliformis caledonium TaxID=1117310 RepID=A0A9N9E9Z3_9GLOM|nr:10663_t:CDS:2 [Funneliformis caledonium]